MEYVIHKVKKIGSNAHLIIKSTVPIGFRKKISVELGGDDFELEISDVILAK